MSIPTTKENVEIEVHADHVLIVFPGKCDDFVTPYQEAMIFGDILERAAEGITNKPLIINPVAAELESQKLAVKPYRKQFVAFIFDHTDRISLSYEAARIVARSIRCVAQDLAMIHEKKVHIKYDVPGRLGRPTPFFDNDRFPKTFGTGRS